MRHRSVEQMLGIIDDANLDYDPDASVVPIVRRAKFSFDGRATGVSQMVPLATAVDVSSWASGGFLFLLHDKNAWLTGVGGNTTLLVKFAAYSTSLEADTPEVEFVDPSRVVASAPDMIATTSAPRYSFVPLARPFGPQLRVFAMVTQGAAAAAAAQTLTVSIELVGRRK